jgi:hypothetical protein
MCQTACTHKWVIVSHLLNRKLFLNVGVSLNIIKPDLRLNVINVRIKHPRQQSFYNDNIKRAKINRVDAQFVNLFLHKVRVPGKLKYFRSAHQAKQ